jgi:hypothetical protein
MQEEYTTQDLEQLGNISTKKIAHIKHKHLGLGIVSHTPIHWRSRLEEMRARKEEHPIHPKMPGGGGRGGSGEEEDLRRV